MILSGHDILRAALVGDLTIKPLCTEQLQPASYDVRLGSEFREPVWSDAALDPYEDNQAAFLRVSARYGQYDLEPHGFALGATIEHVTLGDQIVGRVEGKSSLGRLGLLVHATAGFIDPGFSGTVTLELYNLTARPIRLTPGMPIAQLAFERLSSPAECYRGKYQDQDGGPVVSRYHLNQRPA